ncbi:MAG: hypothetical protein OEZ68_09160 [Gammaproteobacteria bacterium]|nr:hypothetical protein [Gammaproteobacteria bacterium]MDH5800957.1 hypothetical protein [Gammaproteobacteria bacterium]
MQLLKIVLIVNVLAGCSPFLYSAHTKDTDIEFFSLSRNESAKKFKKYSLERQFELYLAGMNRHPPYLFLAKIIAQKGEQATRFLVGKLEEEKNEMNQFEILFIFETMKSYGYYDISQNQTQMKIVKNAIDSMTLEPIRKRSKDSLLKITATNQE